MHNSLSGKSYQQPQVLASSSLRKETGSWWNPFSLKTVNMFSLTKTVCTGLCTMRLWMQFCWQNAYVVPSWVLSSESQKLDMLAHTCDPSTLEVEMG